jgi:hypothetical protein
VTTRQTITPYTDSTVWICDRCKVQRDHALPRLIIVADRTQESHLCGDCLKVIEEVLDWPARIELVS